VVASLGANKRHRFYPYLLYCCDGCPSHHQTWPVILCALVVVLPRPPSILLDSTAAGPATPPPGRRLLVLLSRSSTSTAPSGSLLPRLTARVAPVFSAACENMSEPFMSAMTW
jgi:hypothetical protein